MRVVGVIERRRERERETARLREEGGKAIQRRRRRRRRGVSGRESKAGACEHPRRRPPILSPGRRNALLRLSEQLLSSECSSLHPRWGGTRLGGFQKVSVALRAGTIGGSSPRPPLGKLIPQ